MRLILNTAAGWLMLGLRETIPAASPLAKADVATLRIRALKVGARIIEKVARQPCSPFPSQFQLSRRSCEEGGIWVDIRIDLKDNRGACAIAARLHR